MKSGTFVVDLSALDKVRVKADVLIAEVQGGANMQNVTTACSALRLVTACGTNPGTGVGGAALSGGYGWFSRTHGFVVDNIIAAEVVLPNGELVLASEDGEHADLLWALRGGGGNFGIVVSLHLRLYPAPPSIIGGKLVHFAPTKAAKTQILRDFDNLMHGAPSEVTGAVILTASMFVHTVWCYIGNAKSWREVSALQAAERLGGLRVVRNSLRGYTQFDDIQRMLRPFQRSGHRFDSVVPIGKAAESLSDTFVTTITEAFSQPLAPHIQSACLIMFSVGGNCALKDNGVKTCLTEDFRNSRYFAIIGALWDVGSGERGREAARKFCKDVKEICSVVKTIQTTYSANELEDDPFKEHSFAAGDEDFDDISDSVGLGGLNREGYHNLYDKLRRVKEKYDPYNMLQQNVNIKVRRRKHLSKNSERAKQWQEYLAMQTTRGITPSMMPMNQSPS